MNKPLLIASTLFLLLTLAGCAVQEDMVEMEQYMEKEQELETLQEEKVRLAAENETLQTELAEHNETIAARNETVRDLQTRVDELEEKEQRLERLQEQNTKLEESLNEIQEAKARREGADVIVTLESKILFGLGSHELRQQARDSLDELGSIIAEYSDRPIVVEGHTDTVPVLADSRFPTNWHLSAARAVSVVEYLVEEQQLDPNQFFAGGYGEHRPIRPNDTEEDRALNRRVEITFLPPRLEEEILETED